jgi:hypothetical protein
MSRWLPVLFALSIGSLLGSCATLSQEQCQAGDWRSIGVADGAEGRPASYVSNHVNACAEYGIGLDQPLYQVGRAEGLRAYCTLENAADVGLDGERYYGVCEGNIGVAFARVHGAAERVHDLEAELNSIDSDIDRLARRLRQGGLSEGEAAALVREIRSLQRDSDSVRRQIRLADNRLRAIQREEQLRLASAGA